MIGKTTRPSKLTLSPTWGKSEIFIASKLVKNEAGSLKKVSLNSLKIQIQGLRPTKTMVTTVNTMIVSPCFVVWTLCFRLSTLCCRVHSASRILACFCFRSSSISMARCTDLASFTISSISALISEGVSYVNIAPGLYPSFYICFQTSSCSSERFFSMLSSSQMSLTSRSKLVSREISP